MNKAEGEGAFKCPRCGATTSGSMAYCMDCGKDLNIRCPGCGATWRFYHGHRFCPHCGSKVGGTKAKVAQSVGSP